MGKITTLFVALIAMPAFAAPKNIYHKGWIDFNKNGVKDIYEDSSQPIEKRIDDLLGRMNIDEKTCQMATLYGTGRVLKDLAPVEGWKQEVWKDGIGNIDEQMNGIGGKQSQSYPYSAGVKNRHAIQRWFVEQTRLGIPVDFTNEGIRGLCADHATMFPAQSAQGSTWDKQLIRRIGEVEGLEARTLGFTNIYSPILDVARDPRWGRAVESYGEDTYLVGELGKQMTLGLQSRRVVSTLKHYAVYSIPVGGRDGGTRTDPHVAPREMRTLFLEQFRKVVQEGGALGVMASYNDYDGIPVIGSKHFLTDILRHEFGFKGYVVSDSHAVEYLHEKHRVTPDAEHSVAQVVNAGLNVRTDFSPPTDFILPLRQAVADGLVSEETLNERVRDILRVKFWIGLFDDPYIGDEKTPDKYVHTPEHQQLSLQAALESMVLLKNEDNLLPLSKNLKRLAVIGPNANEEENLVSRYGPSHVHIKTVLEGLREALPQTEITYSKGCDIIDSHFPESELTDVPLDSAEQAQIAEAVRVAKNAEAVVLVLGGNEKTVREGYSRSSLDLPGRQEQLLEAVAATGKPVVLVLVDGRAETINWAQKHVKAILHAWFAGETMGTAIAQVLLGDYNPAGRLAVTFPKSVGQIPLAFPFKPGSDSKGTVRVWGTLYPFGYGLSYTHFDYSGLAVSKLSNDSVKVTCTVRNAGERDGDEVVQLYLRDDVSSAITYEKMLRGFERIHLKAGEGKQVEFVLRPHDLGLWNADNEFKVEPGTFTVMVGASSEDIRLTGHFRVD